MDLLLLPITTTIATMNTSSIDNLPIAPSRHSRLRRRAVSKGTNQITISTKSLAKGKITENSRTTRASHFLLSPTSIWTNTCLALTSRTDPTGPGPPALQGAVGKNAKETPCVDS